MKPRLKLSTSGTLTLVTPGITGLSPHATRRLIWRHHGSLAAFAKRFGIRYDIVCAATTLHNVSRGPKVAAVQTLLGLPIRLSKREQKRHTSKALIDAAMAPFARLPVEARAPEAPAAQSARANAGTAGNPAFGARA